MMVEGDAVDREAWGHLLPMTGVAVTAVAVVSCSQPGGGDGGTATTVASVAAVRFDEVLGAELVAMGREDQLERTDNPDLPPGTKLGPPKDG